MLAAAEDFLRGADAITRAYRMPDPVTWDAMVEQVNRAAENLVTEVSRVQLLFGRKSAPAGYARTAWTEFRKMGDAGAIGEATDKATALAR
jgi:hypothetical protein